MIGAHGVPATSEKPRQPCKWRGAGAYKSGVVLGSAGVSVSLRLEFISSRPSYALGIRKLHG